MIASEWAKIIEMATVHPDTYPLVLSKTLPPTAVCDHQNLCRLCSVNRGICIRYISVHETLWDSLQRRFFTILLTHWCHWLSTHQANKNCKLPCYKNWLCLPAVVWKRLHTYAVCNVCKQQNKV